MSVRSHEAFFEQIRSGKRVTDAQRIYKIIENNPHVTLDAVEHVFGFKHQTASARLSDLCDMGVIYEDDKGYFHITPEDKILQYAAKRDDEKYMKWKKLGEKNGWFNQLRIDEISGRNMLLK